MVGSPSQTVLETLPPQTPATVAVTVTNPVTDELIGVVVKEVPVPDDGESKLPGLVLHDIEVPGGAFRMV